jgi:hypothetical protein
MGPLFQDAEAALVQRHVGREGLLSFGNQQPAALAGLGPVAFTAALGRMMLLGTAKEHPNHRARWPLGDRAASERPCLEGAHGPAALGGPTFGFPGIGIIFNR